MTTIAWDGRYLAADTLVTNMRGRRVGTMQKIRTRGHALGDARWSVAAYTGNEGAGRRWAEWALAGRLGEFPIDKDENGEFTGLFVERLMDGSARTYMEDQHGRRYDMFPLEAYGSGSDLATGAMGAGVPAYDAVNIASASDVWTGGDIQWVDTEDEHLRVYTLERQMMEYQK